MTTTEHAPPAAPATSPGVGMGLGSPAAGLAEHVPAALVERLLAQLVGKGAGVEATQAPFTGEELFTYPISTESDVEDAFARARVAQREWAARPVAERAQILARIHHMPPSTARPS